MTRDGAYQTLTTYTQSQSLIRHHLAVESAMRALAQYLSKTKNQFFDVEEWGITGLLHDADYELTRKHPEKHTLYLEEKLGEQIPEKIMYAIKAHNFAYTKVQPISFMDWALYCCDELTGFIVACTLVLPDKKIRSLTGEFILKKMEDSSFAQSVNREQIKLCEKSLGIKLPEFIQIVLNSMQAIDTQLSL